MHHSLHSYDTKSRNAWYADIKACWKCQLFSSFMPCALEIKRDRLPHGRPQHMLNQKTYTNMEGIWQSKTSFQRTWRFSHGNFAESHCSSSNRRSLHLEFWSNLRPDFGQSAFPSLCYISGQTQASKASSHNGGVPVVPTVAVPDLMAFARKPNSVFRTEKIN